MENKKMSEEKKMEEIIILKSLHRIMAKLDDLTNFEKLENPIEIVLEQFECPSCKIKVYINKDDVKEIDKELDCSFCNVHGIKNTRAFKLVINEIFEK